MIFRARHRPCQASAERGLIAIRVFILVSLFFASFFLLFILKMYAQLLRIRRVTRWGKLRVCVRERNISQELLPGNRSASPSLSLARTPRPAYRATGHFNVNGVVFQYYYRRTRRVLRGSHWWRIINKWLYYRYPSPNPPN